MSTLNLLIMSSLLRKTLCVDLKPGPALDIGPNKTHFSGKSNYKMKKMMRGILLTSFKSKKMPYFNQINNHFHTTTL